jgi:hypothetical protein
VLICKHSAAILDIRLLINFVTCRNKACKFYGSLVNAYQCENCEYCDLQDKFRMQEGPFTQLRPDVEAQKIFADFCSRCIDYNQETHTCNKIHSSKTSLELIEDARRHCPRTLW